MCGFVEFGEEQVGCVVKVVVVEIDDIVGQCMEVVVEGDELLVVGCFGDSVGNVFQGIGKNVVMMFGEWYVGVVVVGESVDELVLLVVV